MSKGTKTTNEPWKEAKPYMLGGANTLNNVYNQNAGTVQNATNQVTELLPGMIDKYKAGDSAVNAARSYNTDVLAGNYLNGNPYLDQMIAQSGDDLRNQMQAAMRPGMRGGSQYADIISRNLAKQSLATRYGAYDAERARMGQAAGQAPGIAAADTIQLSPIMQALGASTTPINAASQYAGSLGGLLGGYQTQKGGPSTGSQIASGIGTALQVASLFSDERLKTDIKPVGKTEGGLNVYSYRYKAGGPKMIGVMAQEVAKVQPEALGPIVDGYMTVNYEEVR